MPASLLDDPSLASLPAAAKNAIALAAASYPEGGEFLRRLAGAAWFRTQPTADQVRSARVIGAAGAQARKSAHPLQTRILTNTLGHFLPPTGHCELAWANLDRLGDGIAQWGQAEGHRLTLSRAVEGLAVDANADGHRDATDIVDGSKEARQLFFGTIVHEVSHILTGGTPGGTFARFEDEYRAWYVAFSAEFGRAPNRGEAWSRSQELLGRAYPDLQAALRAVDLSGTQPMPTADGRAILQFLGEFYRDGHEPDPKYVKAAVRVTGPWHIPPNPFQPAPRPSGNLENS